MAKNEKQSGMDTKQMIMLAVSILAIGGVGVFLAFQFDLFGTQRSADKVANTPPAEIEQQMKQVQQEQAAKAAKINKPPSGS